VRAIFLNTFANIRHDQALAHAGELLLKAADTPQAGDIQAATTQIELCSARSS
jgi:hypothetical protein